jgi:hypothetical protein
LVAEIVYYVAVFSITRLLESGKAQICRYEKSVVFQAVGDSAAAYGSLGIIIFSAISVATL